jgi:ribosomal protein S18 acetylase RimI-like enzyme
LKPALGGATRVRRFRTEDLFDVLRIAASSLDRAYDPELFLTLARHAPDLFLVAEGPQGSGLDGFVLASSAGDDDVRILLLAVDPSRQRAGVGRRLLKALEGALWSRGARSVRLEVRAENEAARAFYRAHAFQEERVEAGLYEDGHDAVLMRRRLA